MNFNSLNSFEAYYATRSISARNKLVLTNLGLARKAALEMSRKSFVPFEDLKQVADLHLVQCVEKFNPTLGYSFSSYALPILRGRLLNFIRDKACQIRVPRKYFDTAQKSRAVEKKLVSSLGRTPTPKEQTGAMGITIDELRTAKRAIHYCRYLNLEDKASHKSASKSSYFNPDDLEIDLSRLDKQEKLAIETYFFKGLTLSKSAKKLNKSQPQMLELLRSALTKIEVCDFHVSN